MSNYCNLFVHTARTDAGLGFGVGYGVRYPTARNQQTKPSAVPQMRHPPLSERYLSGTRSTPLIRNDDRAHKRLADQMHMQTSGDYGEYAWRSNSSLVTNNPHSRKVSRGHRLQGSETEQREDTITDDTKHFPHSQTCIILCRRFRCHFTKFQAAA